MSQFEVRKMEDGRLRSTAKDADETYEEHGFGEDDWAATGALALDLISRGLQAGSKGARERLIRKAYRALEACQKRSGG